jgi:hypothetical protein
MNREENSRSSFAEARADLISRTSVPRLAKHYSDQLEAAGWQRLSVNNGDQTAFSAWKLADTFGRVWTGTLLVYGQPELPDRRFVVVRVDALE